MEGFLGQIVLFAGNFAPRSWALCQGQILAISTNTALFSILGTTYGGNGQTTFALPDLRSRVPVGQGQGPGLSSYALGQQSGTETVTLIAQQIPPHPHTVNAYSDAGDTGKPANNFLGSIDNGYKSTSDGTQMSAAMIGGGGGNQPHDNIQPYTTLNYIICVEGLYPSRN
jgi:microcystin-dependent protein